MTSPLVTRGQPRYYLHMALTDLVLAALAACVWQGVVPLDTGLWALIPAWVWPTLTALLVLSAGYAYMRHRRRTAENRR